MNLFSLNCPSPNASRLQRYLLIPPRVSVRLWLPNLGFRSACCSSPVFVPHPTPRIHLYPSNIPIINTPRTRPATKPGCSLVLHLNLCKFGIECGGEDVNCALCCAHWGAPNVSTKTFVAKRITPQPNAKFFRFHQGASSGKTTSDQRFFAGRIPMSARPTQI